MKKLSHFLFKFLSNGILMCAMISISQCCSGKIFQIPVTKELREKVRSRINKEKKICLLVS